MNSVMNMQTIDTERIRRACKNREIQLQRWEHFEKMNNIMESDNKGNDHNKKTIQFPSDIVLLEAISRNDLIEVQKLFDKGANPNAANIDGLSGLHQCCIDDYTEMATLLIKHGAKVNSRDSEAWSPLHAAATCGRDQMVLLLSNNGADFLALNADGNMPYDICEGEKCLAIIENEMSKRGITQDQIDECRLLPEQVMSNDARDLVSKNQSLDQLDNQGANMLHISCSLGYLDTTQTLLELGADVNKCDIDGWQPIHIAACWGHAEIIELLIAFGADIDAKTRLGDSAFDICDPDFQSKLISIKQNVINIRRHFNPQPINRHRSFRKSHGSSIRRTSTKQKSRMALKEAKEEFLVMNSQSMPQTPEEVKSNQKPATTTTSQTPEEIKSNQKPANTTSTDSTTAPITAKLNGYNSKPINVNNNDECHSDVDESIDVKPTSVNTSSAKNNVKSSSRVIQISTDCNNNKTVNTPIISEQRKIHSSPTKLPTPTNSPKPSFNKSSIESKNHLAPAASAASNTTTNTLSSSSASPQFNNNSTITKPHVNSKASDNNSISQTPQNDNPLNRSNPYRFSSDSEPWDPITGSNKERRRKGCCQII